MDIPQVKKLIDEYLSWINISLDFQNIAAELASFPDFYGEPSGSFFVAKQWDEIIGCVGLKPLEQDICEMKRLFVIDRFKGSGVGKQLITQVLIEAKSKSYAKMRLDTLPIMAAAHSLYKSFGFYEIGQYVRNPIAGAIFMEIDLLTIPPISLAPLSGRNLK